MPGLWEVWLYRVFCWIETFAWIGLGCFNFSLRQNRRMATTIWIPPFVRDRNVRIESKTDSVDSCARAAILGRDFSGDDVGISACVARH